MGFNSGFKGLNLNFLDIFSTNAIKLHENPFSGSRVVSCGRTDERTDMTKLRVIFRDFVSADKKVLSQLDT